MHRCSSPFRSESVIYTPSKYTHIEKHTQIATNGGNWFSTLLKCVVVVVSERIWVWDNFVLQIVFVEYAVHNHRNETDPQIFNFETSRRKRSITI